MDAGRAFSYVTHDADWVKKALIGGVMVLFSFLIIPAFILTGYELAIVRRVYAGSDVPLPEWDNFGDLFMHGLIATAGLLVWALPVWVLYSCAAVGVSASSGDGSAAVALLAVCVGLPLALLFGVFVYPVLIGRYAVEGRFGAMFEFSEIFAEIRRAPGALLQNAVVTIIAVVLAYFGFLACIVGVLFTFAYAYFVTAHSLGQAYRQARGVGPRPEPTAAF